MDVRSYDMDAAKNNKPRANLRAYSDRVELRCEAQSTVTWTHRSCPATCEHHQTSSWTPDTPTINYTEPAEIQRFPV